MGRLSISRKIGLNMFAIVAVILVLSVVAKYALSSTVSTFSGLIENETAMMQHANDAKIFLLRCRREEKDALYNDDESMKKSIEGYIVGMQGQVASIVGLVDKTEEAGLKDAAGQLAKAVDDYQGGFRSAVQMPVGQERMRAAIPMRRAANESEKLLNSLIEQLDRRIKDVKDSTMQHASRMQTAVIGAGLLVILFGLSVGFSISRSVSRPIRLVTSVMRDLAGGNKKVEILYQERGDEIGDMARAVMVFKENMIKNETLEADQAKEREIREKRAVAIERYIGEFQKTSTTVVQSVTGSATQLQEQSRLMSSAAQKATDQADIVSHAANEATTNVQTVASAAEELHSSITEIEKQVVESARITASAVRETETTNETIEGLAEAAQKIGAVVELINDIAGQTNLLALNATIEAARAGEAGKGFAVVAQEVKVLADQTAKATKDITDQIQEMQAETGKTVTAIRSIGSTIGRINQISTSIASAVEEQTAATNEIARSIEQAAAGTRSVSSNIQGVTQVSAETSKIANEVLDAGGYLTKEGNRLRDEIEGFISKVRSA